MTRRIEDYLTRVPPGWDELIIPMIPESRNFICREKGVQVVVGIKETPLPVIHVSVAPVYSLKADLSPAKLRMHILLNVGSIIAEFFGQRKFAMQPDDPRKPDVKHYFHVLEEGRQ